jgi:hypothetical protein
MPAPGDVSAIASPVVSFTVADRSRRDLHNAGVRVGCDLTDKIDASVAYAYTMVDYDLDAILDASEYVGLAEGGYRVTDKTVATLAVQYGLEDTDAFEDNADFVAARVGLRSSRTDKIQYKGGIGWQTYMRPNEAGEDASGVSLNATATWQATDKIAVEAGARNDILASSIYKNNVRETASGLVGVNYRATAAVTASFTGAHAREEHKDPVDIGGGATKIRKDESTTVSSRVSYAAPVRLVSLFVEVSYGVVNSTISDYTELRGGAGMTVRY